MKKLKLYNYDCCWWCSDYSEFQVGNNNSPLFDAELREKTWSVWRNDREVIFTGTKAQCLRHLGELTGCKVVLRPMSAINRETGNS